MILYSDPDRDLPLPAPLVEQALRREPIDNGESGAVLERIAVPGGRTIVCKHISPALDWMMPLTHDVGRAAVLWTSGTMQRCPPEIDTGIVRIEADGANGWRIYMDDLGSLFRKAGTRFSRAEANRLLAALAALHEEFWLEEIPVLARLPDLLTICSPRSARRHPESGFHRHVLRGWETFAELAPADVADAVFALLDDPEPFARQVEQGGTTMTHSDPHFGNTAIAPERIVLIDWSLAAQTAPAVDFAWFVDQSQRFVDATHDELAEDFLRLEKGRTSPELLDLALLAELGLAGWQAGEWVDLEDRAAHRAGFDWIVDRARRAVAAF
jgi:hypothetical protein